MAPHGNPEGDDRPSGRTRILSEASSAAFRLRDDKVALQIWGTLSLIALALMTLHVVTYLMLIKQSIDNIKLLKRMHYLASVQVDNSIPEIFNHGMLFMAAFLFLVSFYEVRARILLIVSVFTGFAWVDDSMQYHERVGGHLAKHFEFMPLFGLRSVDVGELLAWSMAGVAMLPLFVWAYLGRRSGDANVFRLVALPLIALVACGVVFDMIHILFPNETLGLVLTILEDGGEMLAVAALVAVALTVLRNAKKVYAGTQT
jgi:hypothetical protein